ncbi:MAG: 16S rRNA processing protein RimM [Spirochaetaceae bacterium]|nr:16S rRNA processing protein RimM [Spirochaetaceae bacterium]
MEKNTYLKSSTDDLLASAIIRAPFGLDGYVKVESLSGELEHFANLKRVYIQFYDSPYQKRTLSDGFFKVCSVIIRARDILMQFEGVTDPVVAKQFKSATILLPRDEAAPLYEGEYYISDLCNCVLVYKGEKLGHITNVIEGGSSYLIELTEAGTNRLVYIPFNDEFIGEVNLEQFTVQLMHRWILD